MNLLSASEKIGYDQAFQDLFETFATTFSIYQEPQKATISTSLTFSRFGQHDQNAAVSADNVANVPRSYVISGCIEFGNKLPWDYIAPAQGQNAQQDKLRNAMGMVRVKVDATGYGLLRDAKLVTIDDWDFQPVTTPRPHGLVGAPSRWTFYYQLKQ